MPRQPSTLAPSAHPRGAFLSYGNEVSYTTGKRRNSFGIPPLFLFLILKLLPTRAHHPASLLRRKSFKNKVIKGSAAGIQLCLTFYRPCNGRTAKQVPADVFGYRMHCTAVICDEIRLCEKIGQQMTQCKILRTLCIFVPLKIHRQLSATDMGIVFPIPDQYLRMEGFDTINSGIAV